MARRWHNIRKPAIAVKAKATVHGPMVPVRVVLHDTESHSTAGIKDIQGIYDFWGRQGLGYGAHFVVDKDGNIGQGASCRSLLYHVGNYNTGSVGIEQIGYSWFLKAMWRKTDREQLRSVAKLLAFLHKTYRIPLVISIDRGICTHAMVGRAGIDPTGHTDPGKGYPLRFVVWLARRYVKRGGWYTHS
jgi:N-acetyl-anhydromuramyl-L-alanine amidase AmpD